MSRLEIIKYINNGTQANVFIGTGPICAPTMEEKKTAININGLDILLIRCLQI